MIVPLHHPSNLPFDDINNQLKAMVTRRTPYHKRYLFMSVILIPFTASLSVLPGPNVFLLYNVVRVVDHYKAYRGCQTLNTLIQNKEITGIPDPKLDSLWTLWTETAEAKIVPQPVIEELANDTQLGSLILKRHMMRAKKQVETELEKSSVGKKNDDATQATKQE
jgi:hypothetical protein